MSKEIDEIIEQIKTAIRFKKMPIPSDYHISIYDMEQLLDYITNLQEEMEILRSDYIGEKLKNDKAIEYIKNYIEIDEETGTYCMPYTFDAHNLYKILKMLEGKNDETE